MNDQFNDNNANKTSNPWHNPYQNNFDEEQSSYRYPNEARFPKDNSNYSQYNNGNGKKNNLKTLLTTLIVVTSVSIVGLFGYISYKSTNNDSPAKQNTDSSTSEGINPNAEKLFLHELTGEEEGLRAQDIYQKLVKSTVGVVMYDKAINIIAKEAGQGTGVVVSKDGYIVTNSHVVGNSKSSIIKVILNEDEEVKGQVVGFDEKTDLAVIKIDRNDLIPVEFGDSDQISVGTTVLALGNPAGLDFKNSLTKGIISAANRSLGASNLVTYFQTDAPINQGNSGGPLIDMYGRVIGINSNKIFATGFEGMGFSIPSKIVKTVIDDIIKQGYVSGRSQLGILVKDVSDYVSQLYNVPQGILITDILKGSDLSSQNIQTGDIITQVNGKPTTSSKALMNEVAAYSPGDTIKLTIHRTSSNYGYFSQRSSSSFEVTVKLTEDTGENQNIKKDDSNTFVI